MVIKNTTWIKTYRQNYNNFIRILWFQYQDYLTNKLAKTWKIIFYIVFVDKEFLYAINEKYFAIQYSFL